MHVRLDSRLGTDLAGYRIEAVLGRGGMGVVYRATDPRLKRPVALKLLALGRAEDPRFRERFLRESELAVWLDHSHVIPSTRPGKRNASSTSPCVAGRPMTSPTARAGAGLG